MYEYCVVGVDLLYVMQQYVDGDFFQQFGDGGFVVQFVWNWQYVFGWYCVQVCIVVGWYVGICDVLIGYEFCYVWFDCVDYVGCFDVECVWQCG